jgi:hypothetical protein
MTIAANRAPPTARISAILCRQTANELKAMKPRGPLAVDIGGVVYFVEGAGGALKIGFARKIEQRLAELQTGSPVRLRVVCTIKGGIKLEREYHRKFAEHRLHGEWFRDCREIRKEIARLKKAVAA